MLKVETKITIKQPIETVYDYVTHIENNRQWQSAVGEVKRTSEGVIAVGSTYEQATKFLQHRASNLD